ncbi:MAG TPA: hypothetical protein VGC14_20410, partial [Rhizobium sp.]
STMRMARLRTSGENLFVVLLMMAPLSQKLEPPANPARFKFTLGWVNPTVGKYERPEGWTSFDGEGSNQEFMCGNARPQFNGDGCHIGRKLLRDHVKDQRKLAKALDRTRVSPSYGRYL